MICILLSGTRQILFDTLEIVGNFLCPVWTQYLKEKVVALGLFLFPN